MQERPRSMQERPRSMQERPLMVQNATLRENKTSNHDHALQGIMNERVETLCSAQIYIAGKPSTSTLFQTLSRYRRALRIFLLLRRNRNITPRAKCYMGRRNHSFLATNNDDTRSCRFVSKIQGPPVAYHSKREIALDVTIHDSLVRCEKNRITVACVNTSDEARVISAPVIVLEDVETVSNVPPVASQTEKSKSADSRALDINSKLSVYERIRELNSVIPTTHLSEEEKNYVSESTDQNFDLFHLASNAPGKTETFTHKNLTTYEAPRETALSSADSQEKDGQANEQTYKHAIENPNSPCESPLWIEPEKPGQTVENIDIYPNKIACKYKPRLIHQKRRERLKTSLAATLSVP
ncbi:unnamed protein product [Heterotrigona itama]|uniref:Uncharacterized protein n=1 Tax=Heterotrigona itama TaxID=395501 RepID=A0A6V7GTK4_9HYME|nr:unnamed protein product [Heterotrigona itama]